MKPTITTLLILLISIPLSSSSVANTDHEDIPPWWETTSMDLDRDGVHDAIWKAISSEIYDWVDDSDTISVIVDEN